ncbi:transmembrane protein 104 homolog [Anthonomus grandis grandis]|uniref:transmembrane protein 104 homolog n=1 Tax=Anthonomus grandis grandis TaxID=2921223 RepID=UPI00216612B5|nr:transmembrane protein 104 homolog [Anthonomus grandis grandis]
MPEMDQYPPWVGLIYIFNLIVGTGALTLPAAFADAGWLFSTIAVMVLCFVSFITITFVIESMACANATIQWRKIQEHKVDESEALLNTDSDGSTVLDNSRPCFNLNHKVELGEMASLYLSKSGHMLFFITLCIYLFGDLTIYVAASGKTLVNLSCTGTNSSENFTEPCWEDSEVTRMDMYRIYVVLFGLLVGPFTYFNVQKTKYLQFFTISIRWIAFTIMVTLACVRLINNGQQGHPSLINVAEIPALAGSSVYSFMCHHSLPGLLAPISNKNRIIQKVSVDLVLICGFYLLLSLTGSFAFKSIDVLYSLNFMPAHDSGTFMKTIGTFLAAFPLFPMTASFPIIAITMQGNLKHLCFEPHTLERRGFLVRRLLFPSLAIFPPLITALSTHNLKGLIEITGSYVGVAVQYIIPALLVWNARKYCSKYLKCNVHRYSSPFRHFGWFLFVLLWSFLCIVFVTVDLILDH